MNFQQLLAATMNPMTLGVAGAGLGVGLIGSAVAGEADKRAKASGKTGIGGGNIVDDIDPAQLEKIIRATGGANVANAQAYLPVYNSLAQTNLQNAQSMAQTNAALMGQLNQQKYGYNLAGQGLAAQTQLANSMIQNQNPYGVQAFSPQATASY